MLLECGEGIQIRHWDESDAEELYRLADDPGIWINVRDRFPHPYTIDDARSFIASADSNDMVRSWSIKERDTLVGAIGLIFRDDVYRITAEIGYWIGRPHWNRGIATRALRAVSAHAFEAYDLHRLQAEVFEWDAASVRVLEKCGYALEGVMRHATI